MSTQMIETLMAARSGRGAISALPNMPGDIEEAYAVQADLVAEIGKHTNGWKIGCTSAMAQKISRVDEPFFGRMFSDTTANSPARINLSGFYNSIIEPEIAFRIACDLPPHGSPYDEEAVGNSVAAIFPAIEMVDSRYAKAWQIDIRETVSDNGVHAYFVAGPETTDWRTVKRATIPLNVTTNGNFTADGIGANALEDPINALVWLANALARRGLCLSAGDLVTTGNICNDPLHPNPGDRVKADFGPLGGVEISFF